MADVGEDAADQGTGAQLCEAATCGHRLAVTDLLELGADVHHRNAVGRTPLMCASANGHTTIVEALIEAGANARARDPYGSTALMTAAAAGHVCIVRALLAAGASVNSKNFASETALLCAVRRGCMDLVCLLLDSGADANVRAANGVTCLGAAVNLGHEGIVRLLLETGSASKDKAVEHAIRAGRSDILRRMVKAGFSRSMGGEFGVSALVSAAAAGDGSMVAMLGGLGADVQAAFMAAVRQDNRDAVCVLLAEGAEIDFAIPQQTVQKPGRKYKSCPALILALVLGHDEIFDLLLERGADANCHCRVDMDAGHSLSHRTVLMMAARYGTVEQVKALMDRGADVNATDSGGITALMSAASRGEKEVVLALLGRGADVRSRTAQGQTSLTFASAMGFSDVKDLLQLRTQVEP